MGTIINRRSFEVLITEDLEWLLKQPPSINRMHIERILLGITDIVYADKCSCGQTRQHDDWDKCHG